jgi:hypothetical protein
MQEGRYAAGMAYGGAALVDAAGLTFVGKDYAGTARNVGTAVVGGAVLGAAAGRLQRYGASVTARIGVFKAERLAALSEATEAVSAAEAAGAAEALAYLPSGRGVPPTSARWSGYHGTNDPALLDVNKVFIQGLPARGANRNMADHAAGAPDSAFRGTTAEIFLPERGAGGAGEWAGAGGVVYQVEGVPGWNVNAVLEGQRPVGGTLFGGNVMSAEAEVAINAQVAAENIAGAYPIIETARGLRPGTFIPNPNYRGGR